MLAPSGVLVRFFIQPDAFQPLMHRGRVPLQLDMGVAGYNTRMLGFS